MLEITTLSRRPGLEQECAENSITIKGDIISRAYHEDEWEAFRNIGRESEAKGTDKLKARKMTR